MQYSIVHSMNFQFFMKITQVFAIVFQEVIYDLAGQSIKMPIAYPLSLYLHSFHLSLQM